MVYEKTPLILNLQLFAEGAEGGDTGGEGTMGATGVAATSQNQQVKITDADGTTAQNIDRKAEFDKLIKGEYKDLYDAKMQDTIEKRLKGTKETVEKFNALAPMLETLAEKYGVDSTDVTALSKAIEEDESFYAEEALEKGMTVEELKEIKKMKRENAELKRQMDEQKAKENADKVVSEWMRQSESLKSVYPSFDLQGEMQNPRFLELLQVPGVDVRTAYELIHKDEIIAGAMQFTAETVEKKLANKIMANGARPMENGMNSQAASLTKSDVSQLSKADILKYQRKVARGEKVDFTRR